MTMSADQARCSLAARVAERDLNDRGQGSRLAAEVTRYQQAVRRFLGREPGS